MSLEDAIEKLRISGNEQFNDKNYREAIVEYSKGLKLSPGNITILSNRCAAYLNLEFFKKSLEDANSVLYFHPDHEKGKYRKALSLIGLRRYLEAIEFMDSCLNQNQCAANENKAKGSLADLSAKIKNQTLGKWDMTYFLKGIRDDRASFSGCAEYFGPLRLEQILDRGRGYVATRDISAGELLMVSKALAVAEDGQALRENLPERLRCLNPLQLEVLQKLNMNSDVMIEFLRLYPGPDYPDFKEEEFKPGQLDLERIVRIVRYNGFRTDRGRYPATGLWIQPSYFNHSCVRINTWSIVMKDLMFVRASVDIKAGNELLISYCQPSEPLSERQALFSTLGFDCSCDLCELDKTEPEETHDMRADIMDAISTLPDNVVYLDEDLNNLTKLVANLKKFRRDEHLNIPALEVEKKLILHYRASGDHEKAARMSIEHFRLLVGVADDLALDRIYKALIALLEAKRPTEFSDFAQTLRRRLKVHFGDEKLDVNLISFLER